MPSKAEKLLMKLRQTKAGWTARDLAKLYDHFGFTIRSGKKHDIITHPDIPDVRDMLPHESGEIQPDYARDALKSIEKVLARQKEQEREEWENE
jgi:hypothetical protein